MQKLEDGRVVGLVTSQTTPGDRIDDFAGHSRRTTIAILHPTPPPQDS
jgi:hypothetical protein